MFNSCYAGNLMEDKQNRVLIFIMVIENTFGKMHSLEKKKLPHKQSLKLTNSNH